MTENQKKLYSLATQAQKNSHAPYSGAHIGAAVLMSDGRSFSGCNVENASYGGTVCAERIAIFKAISEGSTREISEILVVSSSTKPWPPCGFCRQVIAEFANEQTLIHTSNHQGVMQTFTLSQILPEAFTPHYLNQQEASK